MFREFINYSFGSINSIRIPLIQSDTKLKQVLMEKHILMYYKNNTTEGISENVYWTLLLIQKIIFSPYDLILLTFSVLPSKFNCRLS